MKTAQILERMKSLTEQGIVKGALTEQYFNKTDKDGKPVRVGPYYLLTWSVNGKKKQKRVPAESVVEVEQGLERYREMKSLFGELLGIAENQK